MTEEVDLNALRERMAEAVEQAKERGVVDTVTCRPGTILALIKRVEESGEALDGATSVIRYNLRRAEAAEARAEAAEATVARVEALHSPSEYGCQSECRDERGDLSYPCSTRAALEGPDHD